MAHGSKAHYPRKSFRNRIYGLTHDDFLRMLDRQHYRCLICKRAFGDDLKECVDHDHDTGKVRGLLCSRCNTGLGAFGDDPRLLHVAADYLYKSLSGGNWD